jgi:hypothetical protein
MVGASRSASVGTAFAGKPWGTGARACREAWLRAASTAFASGVLTGSLAGGVVARDTESRVAGHRPHWARTARAGAARGAAVRNADCGAATVRRATRRKC